MHLQIRTMPAQSPADLGEFLAVLERAGLNIVAAGGSNVELGGEFAFAVDDGLEEAAVAILEEAGYHPRVVEVDLCWMINEPGQLLACITNAIRKNASTGRKIKDLAIGVPDSAGHIPVQVYSEEPPAAG